MSKIYSANIHRNENAGIEFSAAILGAVNSSRQQMAILAKSRKADEYAPGAIHALRKLCEGEGKNLHIHRLEVEEWHEIFASWFKRVKRNFSKNLVEDFHMNAEEDFRIILECASDLPESFWRKDVSRRHIQLSFESDDQLKAARHAAEQKHPVQLGSALHSYIESCVNRLIDNGEGAATAQLIHQSSNVEHGTLTVRYALNDLVSVIVDRFDCFNTPNDLAQDIVINAYDVEHAVKSYFSSNSPEVLDDVQFNCESSMFVVHSSDHSALSHIVSAMLILACAPNLFAKYRQANGK